MCYLSSLCVMFAAIPSLRARDCSKNEKEALNYLFLLVPLLNVAIPFFVKSFAVVWSADTVAFFGMYAWKVSLTFYFCSLVFLIFSSYIFLGYLYVQVVFCRWGGYRKWRSDFQTDFSLFSHESFYQMVIIIPKLRKCSRFQVQA